MAAILLAILETTSHRIPNSELVRETNETHACMKFE